MHFCTMSQYLLHDLMTHEYSLYASEKLGRNPNINSGCNLDVHRAYTCVSKPHETLSKSKMNGSYM